MSDNQKNGYDDDPELGDENDPAYREEMFETFRFMGCTPEDLKDPLYRDEYAEWLKKQK
jgi:hypothetical protein